MKTETKHPIVGVITECRDTDAWTDTNFDLKIQEARLDGLTQTGDLWLEIWLELVTSEPRLETWLHTWVYISLVYDTQFKLDLHFLTVFLSLGLG